MSKLKNKIVLKNANIDTFYFDAARQKLFYSIFKRVLYRKGLLNHAGIDVDYFLDFMTSKINSKTGLSYDAMYGFVLSDLLPEMQGVRVKRLTKKPIKYTTVKYLYLIAQHCIYNAFHRERFFDSLDKY